MPHAVLALEMGRVARQVRVEVGLHARAVLGMDAAEPLVGRVADLRVGAAEHRLPARRVVDAPAAQVPVPEAVVGAAGGHRVALLALVQRLVDAHELGRAPRQAADAQAVQAQDDQADHRHRGRAERVRLVEARAQHHLEVRGLRAPDDPVVGGLDQEPVAAGQQVRVVRDAPVGRLHPGGVEALQPVAEAQARGRDEVHGAVAHLQVAAAGPRFGVAGGGERLPVEAHLFDVGDRRREVAAHPPGVDHHDALVRREPEPARPVLERAGLRPAARALAALHAVGDAVEHAGDPRLLSAGEGGERRTADAEDPARTTQPQVAGAVVEDMEDGVVEEAFVGRDLRAAVALHAEEPGAVGAHPEDADVVLVQRLDADRRPGRVRLVGHERAALEPADPARAAGPDGAVAVLEDRAHLVARGVGQVERVGAVRPRGARALPRCRSRARRPAPRRSPARPCRRAPPRTDASSGRSRSG